MTCIVVDDDALSRLDIEHKIAQAPFLTFEGSYASAAEASAALLKKKIDLVFLDIHMPKINGIQFMKSLATERPQIIFVTSSKDFATDAFENDATDYLVKPISEDRFLKAASKAQKIHQNKGPITSADESIFIKVNSRLVKLNLNEILFIEALADYIIIHTANNKYIVHSTMKGVEGSLPENDFFRVHNSYIIRIDKITVIEDNTVVLFP